MNTRRALGTALLLSFVAFGVLAPGAAPPAIADGGGGVEPDRRAPDVNLEDPDFTAAVKSIKRGNFAAAIPLLEAVVERDGNNADAYNWLAYAVRRKGAPAQSIPIYEKALAIEPRHRGAHEYIGEAYLALDNVAKAREHLAKLDALCFFPCSQYRDLKRAVKRYEQSGGMVKPTAGW